MTDFLSLYKSFATEITDAPIEFHDYVGLATIGIALGNKVYFPFGDTDIYPNFWLLLLAPSSSFRKSTALNISKRILYQLDSGRIYPSEFSHEKIIDTISKQPAGSFYFSEFLSLMGLLSRDYMAGSKALLTDLYDSGYSYRRETLKGQIEIKKPAISIMSASTMDWFLQKTKEDDLRGGFIPRFLIVTAGTKTKDMPLPPKADKDKRKALVDILRQYQTLSGAFYLSKEAKQIHSHWYHKTIISSGAGRYDSLIQRMQVYIIKIAMVLEVNNSQTLKISKQTMLQATAFTDFVINNFKDITANEMAFSKTEKQRQTVLKIVKFEKKISRAKLLQYSHLSSRELNQSIETLIEAEEIEIIRDKGDGNRLVTSYSSVNRS